MKKKLNITVTILLIIVTTASCTYKNDSTKKTEDFNGNTGRIQGTQEAQPLYDTQPSPSASAAPEVKKEEKTPPLSNSAADTVLGSCSTSLMKSTKDRINNIKLGAKKINGYEVKTGEIFSFNEVVGKRDPEHGFKSATIIVNGEYDEDIGGGVCQLSSTLYNAVDKAKLEILERHVHSKPVAYLPAGRDAAVSYGYWDFKFKNNRKYPLKIKAVVENSKVSVFIYKAR